MKGKILFATLLILASGLAGTVGNTCLDNQTIMENSSLLNNTHVCDYGCDVVLNRCNTVDTDFSILVLIVLIFFVGVMFYLANYFKPRREDDEPTDLGAIGISFFWLFVGLLGVLGILFFASGVGSPLVSSSIGASVGWIKTFTQIYSYLLGASFVFFAMFYIKALLDNFRLSKGEN